MSEKLLSDLKLTIRCFNSCGAYPTGHKSGYCNNCVWMPVAKATLELETYLFALKEQECQK